MTTKTKIIIAVVAFIFVYGGIETLVDSCSRKSSDNRIKKELAESGRSNVPQNFEDALLISDFEAAHKYYEIDPSDEKELKMARAEVTFLINNDEIDRAIAVSNEYGTDIGNYSNRVHNVFQDVAPTAIANLLENSNFDAVIKIFTGWKFYEDFQKNAISYNESYATELNNKYNSEVSSYNDMVDMAVNKAIMIGDKELAHKIMAYYATNSVLKSCKRVGEDYSVTFELKNIYYEDALERLNKSSIR